MWVNAVHATLSTLFCCISFPSPARTARSFGDSVVPVLPNERNVNRYSCVFAYSLHPVIASACLYLALSVPSLLFRSSRSDWAAELEPSPRGWWAPGPIARLDERDWSTEGTTRHTWKGGGREATGWTTGGASHTARAQPDACRPLSSAHTQRALSAESLEVEASDSSEWSTNRRNDGRTVDRTEHALFVRGLAAPAGAIPRGHPPVACHQIFCPLLLLRR
jgi:hypothetical protein